MRLPIIFDGRNLYDPAEVRRLGFEYFGIGR
jgi:UDPglucose 6-dehydrogenase